MAATPVDVENLLKIFFRTKKAELVDGKSTIIINPRLTVDLFMA